MTIYIYVCVLNLFFSLENEHVMWLIFATEFKELNWKNILHENIFYCYVMELFFLVKNIPYKLAYIIHEIVRHTTILAGIFF